MKEQRKVGLHIIIAVTLNRLLHFKILERGRNSTTFSKFLEELAYLLDQNESSSEQ